MNKFYRDWILCEIEFAIIVFFSALHTEQGEMLYNDLINLTSAIFLWTLIYFFIAFILFVLTKIFSNKITLHTIIKNTIIVYFLIYLPITAFIFIVSPSV